MEFLADDLTVCAFVDVFVILWYKSVEEDFIVEGIDSCLLLLFLKAEEGSENAILDGSMDEHSHLFFRERLILHTKHIPSENIWIAVWLKWAKNVSHTFVKSAWKNNYSKSSICVWVNEPPICFWKAYFICSKSIGLLQLDKNISWKMFLKMALARCFSLLSWSNYFSGVCYVWMSLSVSVSDTNTWGRPSFISLLFFC